jgi:hypothetical protein
MRLKLSIVSFVLLILIGCAAPAPPADLWESQNEVAKYDLPYGIVKAVEAKSYANRRYPDSSGAPYMAMYGAAGMLFADGMSKLMSDKRYVHTIELSSGETITEMSTFEFPVGTCVSVGANGTAHPGSLARSKRCPAAKGQPSGS